MVDPGNSGPHNFFSASLLRVKPRIVLRGVLVFVIYLFLFTLLDIRAHTFEVLPGIVAWYPPDGLSLAFLLTFGTIFLPALAITSVLSSLFVFHFSLALPDLILWGILLSLAYGLIGWFLKRRVRIDTQLRTPRDLFWLVASTALAAALLALISVSATKESSHIPETEQLWATVQWWIGEMSGILVIVPALLIHGMPALKRFAEGEEIWQTIPRLRLSRSVVAQILSIIVVMFIIFDVPRPNDFRPYFLIALPLIWIAIQHGISGASLAILVVNFAIVGGVQSHAFIPTELGQLQLLMFVINLACLFIGIIVSERQQYLKSIDTEFARKRDRVIYELIIISVIAMGTWILEYTFDFFEAVTAWEQRHHIRGLDETLVTISVLGVVWAIFSYRRWKEVEAETRSREQAQAQLQTLYREVEERVRERTANLSSANAALEREITDRKQAETALQEAESKYRILVEQLPAVTYIVQYGEATDPIYVSPQIETLFGFTAQEWLADPDLWFNQMHPEDRDKVLAEFERLDKLGLPIDLDYRILTRAGRICWIHDQSVLIPDETGKPRYGHGLLFDITQRKQTEEALEHSERRLRALIENSLEEISLVTPEGKLIYESPTRKRPLGYPPDSLLGRNLFELFHPDDRDTAMEILSQVKREPGGYREAVFRVRHQNGSWRWLEGNIHNLLDEPSVQAIVINYRDITERKQAEQALVESDRRFRDLFENSPVSIWEEDFSEVKTYLDGLRGEVPTDIEPYLMDHPEVVSACAALVRVLDVNQASVVLQEADSKAMLLGNLSRIFSPQTLAAFQQELITVWNGEQRLEIDGVMQTLSGYQRNVNIIWAVIPGFEEDYSRVLVSLIDITERKLAAEEIQTRNEELSTLFELSRALAEANDMDTVLDLICRRTVESLHTTFARIALQDGDNLATRSAYPVRVLDRDLFGGGRIPIADMPYSQQVIAQDEPVILRRSTSSVGEAERGILLLDLAPTLCLVPLRVHDFSSNTNVTLGLLTIGEVRNEKREPFTQEKLRLARSIGDQAAIAIENTRLFNDLQRSNFELVHAYDATITGWSAALDLRDKETEGHTQRVTEMTVRLAKKMGFGEQEVIHIRRGGLLHDIGKMGVPDRILLKPDKLTDEEWIIMRMHPTYAFQMLKPITYLRLALDIPYCHHEKWDGTGYPRGLRGEQIPLAARIFSIVDVYDALTSDRPYRSAWPHTRTLQYIRELSGSHFDPDVVEVFLKMFPEQQ